jgi:hypothetical protein
LPSYEAIWVIGVPYTSLYEVNIHPCGVGDV